MNPHRSFAFAVTFSGQEVANDPADPVVEVEPCFPGCVVSPPRPRVDLSQATRVARFWVTPLAEGELNDACVRVYHRGRLAVTLLTPTRVVKRTWARVCVAAGLACPAVRYVAARAGWSPTDEVGPVVSMALGAALVGVGLVLYRMTRPIETSLDEVPLLA